MRATSAIGRDTLGAFLGAKNALGGPGGSGSKPRGLRSNQEQPRDLQKQLESDKNEFQKNRKFELQDASGEPRGTSNRSNRLAGAMEKDMLRFAPSEQKGGSAPGSFSILPAKLSKG